MRAKEFINESREDFEGITIEMKKHGHKLVINALDDWGNNLLGFVIFNIGDSNELDPQELEVVDKYQGQGIARVMYDYVKNKGYKIVRSYDQTDAGKGFWDKHRGEEVRVWEESNSTKVISAEKLWDYVSKIHPKDQQGVAEGLNETTWIKPNFDYEWDEIEFQAKQPQVPADVRNYMAKHFPNKQAWMKSVQHGRPVVVSPDHGQKIRNYPDNKRDLLNALSPQSHDPQGPAKAKRVNALFDKGGPIEMPIILQTKKGLWLIGGKTRLGTANLLKGISAKVWMIGGEQTVTEGFSNDMSTEDMIAYLRQHHDTNLHQDYLDHINTFSKFVLQNIPVNSIKTDLPALDRKKVEQYKQMDFSKAPPIVIGGGYILDGYHRANVAKVLGIPTIKAYVGVQGQQDVTEAFNQPYSLQWEEGEFGDYDAYTKLLDGSNLSIMFNKENDDVYTVEFWRNNSQDATGDGDSQKVFATVLGAIQEFLTTKQQPRFISFTSAKGEDGEGKDSRVSLYSKLLQRYATSWGYKLKNVVDRSDAVEFDLVRIKQDVEEGLNESLSSMVEHLDDLDQSGLIKVKQHLEKKGVK